MPDHCPTGISAETNTLTKAMSFRSDSTTRWSCREGDYLLWVRYKGLLESLGAPQEDQFGVSDFWVMKDGDWVTITNRVQDLPPWFELHPLEVAGTIVYWMMKKLNDGYQPSEPLDGPNVWRVFAGDRLVWVGPARRGVEAEDGVLGLIDFEDNALVTGEPFHVSDGLPTFGETEESEPTAPAKLLLRKGWLAARGLGAPRVAAADNQWRLGS
jgi:hypothetical protein